MRVAQVSAYPLSQVSGINKVIVTLASKLAGSGILFTLVCPAGGKEDSSIDVLTQSVRWTIARNLELAIRTFIALVRRRFTLDFIHAHQPHLQSVASLLAARIIDIPSAITFHVRVPDERVLGREFTSVLAFLASRLARVSVLVSERIGKDFGIEKSRVIPNGVDIPALHSKRPTIPGNNGPFQLVFAGRVTQTKGVFVLLEALGKAKKDLDSVALQTFGPMEDRISYERAKQTFGVAGLVEDHGHDEQWHRTLQEGQVFVLPSFYEGLPLALLEAMAHGLAVIATPVGAIPDIIAEGRTGLLVPVGDADKLASAIVWMGRNESVVRAMGHAGRKIVESRYSSAAMAEGYLNLYRELVRRH